MTKVTSAIQKFIKGESRMRAMPKAIPTPVLSRLFASAITRIASNSTEVILMSPPYAWLCPNS